jgi:hypothetical protein
MAQVRRRRRNNRGPQERSIELSGIAASREPKPVRGIKLRTVSTFTMLFAVACLAAFMAGRPPVSLAGPLENAASFQTQSGRGLLRYDDAAALFERSLGKRESRAKKSEKSSRARPPASFLSANSQKKNHQAKNI